MFELIHKIKNGNSKSFVLSVNNIKERKKNKLFGLYTCMHAFGIISLQLLIYILKFGAKNYQKNLPKKFMLA